MTWTHYTFGRTLADPAPRFRPEPPSCGPARSLADVLEESTGLARIGGAAACWDGTTAAVVQVRIAGTDVEGRPKSEVRIRERPADANAFAGCCIALFHKRPIDSEAEWEHATLEIADRGHDRLAGRTLSVLSELWTPSQSGGAVATLAAPTIGAREEAADACLIIRASLALSGLNGPVVVAHSPRSFSNVWASDKWLTLMVANDASETAGPSNFAHVQRFLESNPRGFSELEFYSEKLLEPPSLERLQRAVFISTAIEESARRGEDGGPTYVDLPRLIDLQRRTENRAPARVWEVIRAQLHAIVASDRFAPAPNAPTQVQGHVGDTVAVVLELGTSSLETLERVRDLLGERVAAQVRAAIEQQMPAEEAISSASKTVAQQSNHVVKLRLQREAARVLPELRALPPGASRRAELSALACEVMKDDTPLDVYVVAKQAPKDRVAKGLIELAPRWSGPPQALEQPVSKIDAEWLVQHGETILMSARRVGAETFGFWIPILVEALLRAAEPPPRLIEALLRTNQVAIDDAAALIRHTSTASDFVRGRALELWTSGHKLPGLEVWLPRPTKQLIDDGWDHLPEPSDDRLPAFDANSDPLASLLWMYAARVRNDRNAYEWAKAAAGLVHASADVMAVRALLHHGSTWLPFARDLWVAGYGRLLDGVPFDTSHYEYMAREVPADVEISEDHLLAQGTPAPMADLATEHVIPWLRALRWTSAPETAVEAVVSAWLSNDESKRRAVQRYGWSLVATRAEQPRSEWLDRAWKAWRSQGAASQPAIQFMKGLPAYLQVELVGLGHASLSEVDVMSKTSLPLINVFLLQGGGSYEPAVLYEVPVASTWSLVAALPPGLMLPDAIVAGRGDQQEVLQRAATALDELQMPFCLGVWNHTSLAWKEGRHAWVSSDGRVVCLNTDREPVWFEAMQQGFGPDSTQRMLAVAIASDAPDEMLETVPRARVVRGQVGFGSGLGGLGSIFDSVLGRVALVAVTAILSVVLTVVALRMFATDQAPVFDESARPEAAQAPPEGNGTAQPMAAVQRVATTAAEPVPCPITDGSLCEMIQGQHPGAAAYCKHMRSGDRAFAKFVANPASGPRCLQKKRVPKATARVYDRRQREESKVFRQMLGELAAAGCKARSQKGCTGASCPSVDTAVRESLVNLLAKRFARMLHNRTADRAVPALGVAMPAELRDLKTKSGEVWLRAAMSASCSWQTLAASNRTLASAQRRIQKDFSRLQQRLPSHQEMVSNLSKP